MYNNEIIKHCELFFLENQECGNIKVVIYNSTIDAQLLIIAFIGDQYYVIPSNNSVEITNNVSKKVKIALNYHLPYIKNEECRKIVFKQNTNLHSFPELCENITDIVSQILNHK